MKRQLTAPYIPQQNGVAERKNRSIVGAAIAMLHDQSLPFFLWAEACSIAIYVFNRSPHHALGSKTPEETFTGKVPEIGHFRILVSLHTLMSLLRRGQSWRIQVSMVSLLVMMTHRRIFGFTFLHRGKLW